MIHPEEFRRRLLATWLCDEENLQGCSNAEIKEIEEAIGYALPDDYKDILRVIGRSSGQYGSDLEIQYPSLLTLSQSSRISIAEEDGDIELPPDFFVIADRYGEVVLFLLLGDVPRSHVYRWTLDEPSRYEKIRESVWEFFEEELVPFERK